MSIFKALLFSCFLLMATSTSAQIITGIGTKWSDDFIEWNLYSYEELDEEEEEEIDEEDREPEEIGEINMRWQMQRDWTEWDYRVGDEPGTIRRKWKHDPSQWEISGPNELITARMVWKDDFREWRITNNTISLTLKSRWSNLFDEWILKTDRYGSFVIQSAWEGDPREWDVFDELDEEISVHMKVALLFLATYHSSPKD